MAIISPFMSVVNEANPEWSIPGIPSAIFHRAWFPDLDHPESPSFRYVTISFLNSSAKIWTEYSAEAWTKHSRAERCYYFPWSAHRSLDSTHKQWQHRLLLFFLVQSVIPPLKSHGNLRQASYYSNILSIHGIILQKSQPFRFGSLILAPLSDGMTQK